MYLHTVDEEGKGPRRAALRSAGIRTASDLYTAKRAPDNWAILVGVCGPALDVVMAAIDDDEGMVNILEWRKASRPGERRFNVVGGHALPAPAGA